MTMNRELIREVATFIERHPERYAQGEWCARPDRPSDEDDIEYVEIRFDQDPLLVLPKIREGACQTAACVAGNAVILHPDPASILDVTHVDAATSWTGADRWIVDWERSGHRALFDDSDEDYEISQWLFRGSREESTMPAVLRHLAAWEGDTSVDELLAELEAIEEGAVTE